MSSSEVLRLFFLVLSLSFFSSAFSSTLRSAHATDTFFTMTDHHCQHWLKKKLTSSFCVISCSQARQSYGERPTRPKNNPLVKSLDARMAAWVMSVSPSCFDSFVRCSVLELCLIPPMDSAVRGMISWLPMDELLRSGNRPKPQHWKSDESTEVEETSTEEGRDWNDDIEANRTIGSEGHSSLSAGSMCALVAYDGQAPLRRSISEIDLLISNDGAVQSA